MSGNQNTVPFFKSNNDKNRSIVHEAAATSPIQPIVNMGQGFFGYNPPQFILDAAKEALNHVDCNQYSPTKGRPRLKKAIADAYSPSMGRKLDPETEVTITSGANEGSCAEDLVYTRADPWLRLPERFLWLHRRRRRSNSLRALLRPVSILSLPPHKY